MWRLRSQPGDHAVIAPTAPAHTLALTTRGYEIDGTATVPMPIIFRYFEHVRWTLMQQASVGLVDLVHQGHFFVVRRQCVEILTRVGQQVPLRIDTRFVAAGRSTARVHHALIRQADGALVAHAEVEGVWIGPNRRMARLPDGFRELVRSTASEQRLPTPQPAHSAADAPARSSFFAPRPVNHAVRGVGMAAPTRNDLGDPDFRWRVTVPHRELDVFGHVNAATWLTYCDDARIAAAAAGAVHGPCAAHPFVTRASVTYLQEAAAGDILDVDLHVLADDAVAYVIHGHDGDPGDVRCLARTDLAPGHLPITTPAKT